MMNYAQALRYLESLVNYERLAVYPYPQSFDLSRVNRLLELLGNPHHDLEFIQVAGTKGKGSVCACLGSILKTANFRVGVYTSPHLVEVRERIRILDPALPDQKRDENSLFADAISTDDFCRLLEEIKSAVKNLIENFSFFEILTVLALMYFKEKEVDFAVLEVGLGGRLDATNVVNPLVAAITPISYDHTAILGNALEKIAEEKTGIIKTGLKFLVSAPQDAAAQRIVAKKCHQNRTRLIELDKDLTWQEIESSQDFQTFKVKAMLRDYPILKTSLLGEHQIINAVTALAIAEGLDKFYNIPISENSISQGLADVFWPGRLEILSHSPSIVVDGAHNRQSALYLKKAIKRYFAHQDVILILAILKDKDIPGIIEELEDISGKIILTRVSDNLRVAEPEKLAGFFKDKSRIVKSSNSPDDALSYATKIAKEKDLILITGSLFLVGEALKILKLKGKEASRV